MPEITRTSATRRGNERSDHSWQSPHGHSVAATNYPNAGLEENYCPNLDEEDGVWCYTTSSIRWEVCEVPTRPTGSLPVSSSAPTSAPVTPNPSANSPTRTLENVQALTQRPAAAAMIYRELTAELLMLLRAVSYAKSGISSRPVLIPG